MPWLSYIVKYNLGVCIMRFSIAKAYLFESRKKLNPLRDNELGDCMSPGLAIVSTIYEDVIRSCLYFSVNSRNRSKIFLNLIQK